jgi:heptosyltransferase II
VKPSDISAAKKILIRGTNWVGDAVISIPAMREIRRLAPQAHISLLVRPWVREIYSAVEFVDEILEYDRGGIHRGWTGFGKLVSDLKSRKFDMAILLQNAFEAGFLVWCARIPERIGYARDGRGFLLTGACEIDPAVRRVHQAYYYLDILSRMGWLEERLWERREYPLSIRVSVRGEDAGAAEKMLRASGIGGQEAVLGINPGAYYGPAKRWFPDRYAAVADALEEEYGIRTIIFGSPSDLPVAEEVAANMKNRPVLLTGRTTMGQLMALIRRCRLLITNDSGPMHLAAALDVPQLAIFGSTSEIATGPLSREAVVIKQKVDCNPCFLRECPTDFRCMKGIPAARVLEEARKILASSTATGYE